MTLSRIVFLSALLLLGCAREQSSVLPCKSHLKIIAAALNMYAHDNAGAYPTSLTRLTQGNYLKLVPACPATGTDSYSPSYRFTAARRARNGQILSGSDSFSFHCHGNNHVKTGARANHPAYDSLSGLEER